jgi:hypothetical protein
MLVKLGASLALLFAATVASATNLPSNPANLSAAQVVEKNIEARGGLQAWRAVQTITMEGKMAAGGNQRATLPTPVPGKHNRESGKLTVPQRPSQEAQLPFVMQMKRTRKMRLELQFEGDTAVQVYDGANGWKFRPFLNRRELEPYTSEELRVSALQPDLDGPLVDYAAKGTRIELDSMEKVENRDTYKLKLTMKSGNVIHVWIDANTFLEAKIEGQPRRLDGVDHPVEVYYRDFRQVSGLQIPFVLETKVLPVHQAGRTNSTAPIPAERVVVEKVVVNANLEDSLFSKQGMITSR